MDEVPSEIFQEIFLHLNSGDLWRCLAVSRRWRNEANTDYLWKKHCTRRGIDEIPQGPVRGSDELCNWAAAFYVYCLLPMENWKLGRYKKYHVPLEEFHFIEIWERNRGAVYYYKSDKLIIYEIYSHGIQSSKLCYCFKDIPREVYALSLVLHKKLIAISNYNIAIVYEKVSNSYQPLKVVYMLEEEIKIFQYSEELIRDVFSFDYTIQLKVISNAMLWLADCYGGNYYIVDLTRDTTLKIPVKSFLLNNYSLVALWEDDVDIYSMKGDKILHLDIRCWDLSFNSEMIVLGNKNTQSIETWYIKSTKRLMSKRMLYQTDMAIHPTEPVIVTAEKNRDIYRCSCINALNGQIIWRVIPPLNQNRCYMLKIVSEYVFVWHCYLTRPKYSILNVQNGESVKEGLLPQNRTHVSDTVWVYLEYDHFKIMSFIGSE